MPEHQVSRRAVTWWLLRALAGWLVVVLPQLAVWLLVDDAPGWLSWTLAASALIAVAHTVVMPFWRYHVHRWETTPEAAYTLTGWINREWRVAPLSRIQTVDTKRGLLQQALGLATLQITTASAAGPLHVAGLDHEVAIRLVHELTSATQATPGDAT
ncbi:PH domain-containing protein [Solihabitans fulvus]|uniref:PH domain-containing protein n=2 Tax=Solihabitans fulvus TaxID=1892852 RepID=A0A5B2XCA8_9PSEU|nr:PH domain-containing protein [Solihabitans fulvus]